MVNESFTKKTVHPTIVFRQPDSEEDYEFIRLLRTDPRTIKGFIEQVEITKEQQLDYMGKYKWCYYIAETYHDGIRLGFFGVINDDIRFCVVPYYQNMGVGTSMLRFCKLKYPSATGRIKRDNISSIEAFKRASIPYTLI